MTPFQTLTRWLTPWRTIRRLEAENKRLKEQAVLSAATNRELSILAESRRLKIEALAGPAYRLRKCPTHGQQPPNAWGCPECVRELRGELATAVSERIDGSDTYQKCEYCDGTGKVDDYGNPSSGDRVIYCTFPGCGCDGARLCQAEKGASERSCMLNIERGSLKP
jgi:hypothetical protein